MLTPDNLNELYNKQLNRGADMPAALSFTLDALLDDSINYIKASIDVGENLSSMEEIERCNTLWNDFIDIIGPTGIHQNAKNALLYHIGKHSPKLLRRYVLFQMMKSLV